MHFQVQQLYVLPTLTTGSESSAILFFPLKRNYCYSKNDTAASYKKPFTDEVTVLHI